MSYHSITPVDRVDPPNDLNDNSDGVLPVDRKESQVPKKSICSYSKLSSTWKTYWQTQTTMLSLFVLAWIIAATHLVFFKKLDKQPAEGSQFLSQSYVAALSHLFGLLFRTTLCGSLAVAFTQYLWRLLRVRTAKVSSIELLFKITSNPLLLALPEVVKTAPILFILALFTWTLPIAITFPPGALIVVPTQVLSSYSTSVQLYNGSFLGNDSVTDADRYSLAIRELGGGNWQYLGAASTVQRIGRLVLELDDVLASPSPCGSNCTYNTQFEGPYLRCTKGNYSYTYDYSGGTQSCALNAFAATNVKSSVTRNSRYEIQNVFNMSTFRSFNKDWTLVEYDLMTCIPSRALYDVTVTYRGGLRSITRTEKYLGSILDKLDTPSQYYPTIPACDKLSAACSNTSVSSEARKKICDSYYDCMLYAPANWTQPLTELLAAYNDFALIDALISPLSGNYTMFPSQKFVVGMSDHLTCGATDGTMVADTRLNIQRDNFFRSPADGPEFVLSAEVLNDALFNTTMSAAYQLGFWNTTVPVRVTNIEQQYAFISPKTIIIPYLSCLLISFPFLLLGLFSLRSNGVSAIDGGFLQILMTTTGSKALEKAAAGGCLGGNENIPEDLTKMKIRFGELVGDGFHEGTVRRAGFGTEEEVIALRRDVNYGMQS